MNKRTTFYIGDEERKALEEIQHRHGLSSLSDAFRYAVRNTNQRETQQPTKKPRR